MPSPTTSAEPHPAHSLFEDGLAILIGTLFVSFGISMFNQAGLLTGGTAGLAFLIHYSSNWSFGAVFFVINLPFYLLALRRMGLRFTLKTFSAVSLVALFSGLHPAFIQFSEQTPYYVAVLGGFLMGTGFIVLFRHGASLGGVNILSLYLQERFGLRAGKFQMAVDVAIVLASLMIVNLSALIASMIGAIALNLVIALNHRPGRYMTV